MSTRLHLVQARHTPYRESSADDYEWPDYYLRKSKEESVALAAVCFVAMGVLVAWLVAYDLCVQAYELARQAFGS